MGKTRWLDDEEMRAWQAFLSASALVDRRLDQQLREDAGISHLQYEILVRLSAKRDQEMRMTELADALLNSKSGLTYQVSQLEKAGLVRRRSCTSDDRAVYAVLTPAGERLLERAAPRHVALVRELLIDVLTPEQRAALADGLGEASRRMLDRTPTPTR
ncbi:MAG TPA: MarR family transcriptional regulator [Marmoricola sp.]|jgi:DNA-binding MarR family transcriptional regulator|nr:MarR family transcriptional regulator [Marmoricola sp.]